MEQLLIFLCYLAAFILALLAAFGVGSRVALGWLGLACFVLPSLIAAWPG